MTGFNQNCTACPRLANYLADAAQQYPDYFLAPVPPFGDEQRKLLVVGLAPGFHGANATGRPFTGDYAGLILYRVLHEFGFASAPESVSADDGLRLTGCQITNAVKCVPPQNKPTGAEINTCNPYLKEELSTLPNGAVVVALGKIAHDAVVKAMGEKLAQRPFGHLNQHDFGRFALVDSYHTSRYNVQTGRMNEAMFRDVIQRAVDRF